MSFDEIITFVGDWSILFGDFVDQMSVNIGDLIGDWGILVPDSLKNTTIFGLMFAVGFSAFLIITLVKWVLDLIP